MAGRVSSGADIEAEPDVPRHSGSTLPLWLQPDQFLKDDFEVDVCISELRKYVPIDTLRAELENYLVTLKNKLVEVINEDYGEYANLSTRMVNMDGAVVRMQKPLIDLKAKLLAVRESLEHELATLNQGLQRRQEVGAARSTLELLLEISHVAAKVELLLEEVEGDGGAEVMELDARCRMLERVAGEASRLMFLANKGQELAHIQNLEGRINSVRQRLDHHLQSALEVALQQRSWGAAAHCLHAYVELGEAGSAEEAVRGVLMAPIAQAAAESRKEAARMAGRDQAGRVLEDMLDEVMAQLQQQCAPLLAAAKGSQGGMALFNFPAHSLLPEVLKALQEHLPGVFSPGVPTSFHANWQAASRWLLRLEAMCPSRPAVDALRASPAHTAFLKAWNLPAYSSLLSQEVARHLEEAIRAGRDPSEDVNGGGSYPEALKLGPSIATWQCTQRLVAPSAFLVPVADRLLRLLLMTLQRYAAWLVAVGGARRVALESQEASDSGVPWAVGLPVGVLAAVVRDVEVLAAAVTGQLSQQLQAVMHEMPQEACEAALGALAAASGCLQERGDELLGQVVEEVAAHCAAVLKQLKGISATYRVASRGPPTRPSHYVSGVLVPLKSFLEGRDGAALSQSGLSRLAARVGEEVSSRFLFQADELLTAVRKTETSLKRLKKNRTAEESPGEGALSDSDKVLLQLALDVREFGSQLVALGVDVAALPSFGKLKAFVSSADVQLQSMH